MVVLFFGLSTFPVNDFIRSIFNIHDSINIISIGILFILTIVMGSINARKTYVDEINISNNTGSLNENLNIVMVLDIHLGEVVGKKRLNKMVNEINALNPDLVIIAGDIVDTQIEPFINKNMAEEFSNIKSKYGTYATLGNHDLILGKGEIIAEELRKNNVNVLRNEAVLINDSFYIIGRDDHVINRLGIRRATLEEIISPLEKERYKMVIDHTPNSIEESKELGVNLHFSGHTHKGQIVPFNLVTKKVYEVDHGYKKKDDLNIIVSAGYGTWGPPIRIGSKSEIMNIVIQ